MVEVDTRKSTGEHLLLVVLLQFLFHAWGFNVDTVKPRIFAMDAGSYFGYRVCHFGPENSGSVLVTSPLRLNGAGGVYRCSYHDEGCRPLPVTVKPGTAFGLSLACAAERAVVCGPRLTQECNHLNYLNGVCVELGPQLSQRRTMRPAFKECRNFTMDAVILFDSSRSISQANFKTMIGFIKNVILMFNEPGKQVAVAQYATSYHAVFNFENFAAKEDVIRLMDSVTHHEGNTFTPSAINYVLENMFTEEKGMQKDSKKLLVVITDGKSNDDTKTFEEVLPLAQDMGVTIFAIGVGKEYLTEELKTIASSPKNVFETESFDALKSIQKELRAKIFTIEGMDKSNFSSFEMELSQGGFSVVLSEETSAFGAVGAFSWSGGIEELGAEANSTFINASAEEKELRDSYLGYSVAVATLNGQLLYYAGAPRYKHTGVVLGFQKLHSSQSWSITHRIHGAQLGSYFGAALCVLQGGVRPRDGYLLAVGVPFYHSSGVGGEVRVCRLDTGTPNCSQTLRGLAGNEQAQFGVSLSSCPDLNGDGSPELVVGAPLERQGKGSVYIFLSSSGGISSTFSQRIEGSEVDSALRYFGTSLHSAGDLNSDGLTDLVVGSKGVVTIFRSNPVICVNVSVTLDPPVIKQDNFHCSAPLVLSTPVSKVTVCLHLREVLKGSIQGPLRAAVSLRLELDKESRKPRLVFSPKSASSRWDLNLTSDQPSCWDVTILLPACISDYHDPILFGRLSVAGDVISGTDGLRPVQCPNCLDSFSKKVLLEKVCGEDHVCISDLHVSLNLTSSMVVRTPGFPVDVIVDVTNNGEDASGTQLKLRHPSTLSFTEALRISGKGGVWCDSVSTEKENVTLMHVAHTVCNVGTAVLRQGAKMKLRISFAVSDIMSVPWRSTWHVNVTVMSKNEKMDTLLDNSAVASVDVRLPVNVMVQEGDSTQNVVFPERTQLKHTFSVVNLGETALPVNVTFVVPVEMDSGFGWSVTLTATEKNTTKCSNLQQLSSTESNHCDAAVCHRYGCTIDRLGERDPVVFTFAGNVSRTAGGAGVQIKAQSWALLSFDESLYTQYPADGGLLRSISTEVEVPSTGPAALIATVSVLCSLIVLVLVLAVLYKVGFFKSQQETVMGSDTPPQGDATAPSAGKDADQPVG